MKILLLSQQMTTNLLNLRGNNMKQEKSQFPRWDGILATHNGRAKLIEGVITQMKCDSDDNDWTAIEGLLWNLLNDNNLETIFKEYLPEEVRDGLEGGEK